MSSWFDQLDLGVDLNALQEHLAKSVEEATELVDSLGRMEIMNLDEMAEKQEAAELAEEEDEENGLEMEAIEEDFPGEVIYHDDIQRSPDRYVQKNEDMMHLVSVTEDADNDQSLPSTPSFHHNMSSIPHSVVKKVPVHDFIEQTATTKKSRKALKKKKKKQKVLDFFGTGGYADEDTDERSTHKNDESSISKSAVPGSSSLMESDAAGFALGSLFDVEIPSETPALAEIDSSLPSKSANTDDIQSYLSTFFSSSLPSQGNSASGATGIGSVLSMNLPSSLSFFDTIDEEIDLAEDPILQQVERNRTEGVDRTPAKPSYVSYLESILPPPSRLFNFGDDTSPEDIEEARQKQRQQQQVDRILGLTNPRGSNSVQSPRQCLSYLRSYFYQIRSILCIELVKHSGRHLLDAMQMFQSTLWPALIENSRLSVLNLYHTCIPASASAAPNSNNSSNSSSNSRVYSCYLSSLSFVRLLLTLLKIIWLCIIYLLLRVVISCVWHFVQVFFLTGLYISQSISSATASSSGGGSNNSNNQQQTAEERLQQWRTRWRSLAEDYLSSNNILLVVTAVLFAYSYFRFRRYGTDAGD